MFIVVHLSQQQPEFSILTPYTSVSCKLLRMSIENPPKLDFPVELGFRNRIVDETIVPSELFIVAQTQNDAPFHKIDAPTNQVPVTKFKRLYKKGYQELYIKPRGFSFQHNETITMLVAFDHK